MAPNFKSDESFLSKLAIGAAGTNATMVKLSAMGFNPIELERGSTGYKLWKKIKIKRVRVPDILCLDTGLRFESRGKTKLEISMSHSLKDPKRAWDAGMRDDDVVSIIAFSNDGYGSPVEVDQTSPIHFVRVCDLRTTFNSGQITISKPKGVEEGSEIRVVWPSGIAKCRSRVIGVTPGKSISLLPADGSRQQRLLLQRGKGKIELLPQVEADEIVESNQIVSSVVPVHLIFDVPPRVGETYFRDKLFSVSLSERYAAAKALRYRGYLNSKYEIEARMNDPDEDIYVKLEAAAALAAHGHEIGWNFIDGNLRGAVMNVPLETQLETVIVTSEIPSARSETLLAMVLQDDSRDEELRAGAAWALGEFASRTSALALVDTFNSNRLAIKVEAARALLKIADPQIQLLVDLLKNSSPSQRDGISWALARTGGFDPSETVIGADDDLRKWVAYIVGIGKDRFVQPNVESLCTADPEVYFAASVLWQIVSSWVHDLKEY